MQRHQIILSIIGTLAWSVFLLCRSNYFSESSSSLLDHDHRRSLRISFPDFVDPKSIDYKIITPPGEEAWFNDLRSTELGLGLSIRVPVFYNVYVNPNRISQVKNIITEQMSQMRPEHEVFVRSIGAPIDIENTALIQHDEEGDEDGTLGLLWDHCKNHPTDKVVYIHTKGSFHPSSRNDILRRFLTRGALSQECSNMPLSCNVCSSRMSPIPHPHTSGNMWAARCDYVNRLIDPREFSARMEEAYALPHLEQYVTSEGSKSCVGLGRFAAEHWIHSHPMVKPCDLSTDDKFVWNYKNIPKGDFEMKLEPAPRFIVEKYLTPQACRGKFWNIDQRLAEYVALYNENATSSWWGWEFANTKTAKTIRGIDK